MGLFDKLFNNKTDDSYNKTDDSNLISGAIDYGQQKKDGSHDHRYNKGNDRTSSQKEGDKKKS